MRVFVMLACGLMAASAAEWKEDARLGEIFRAAGVTGTFVEREPGTDRLNGCNEARARERFFPASTFKIPNSLIGLSVGAVKDADEVFVWDGTPRRMKAWEKDMNLREAIRLSCVPVYQELARRIGLERMRENVVKLNYGNADIGGRVDRFWLDGPLKISAAEQLDFLEKLAVGSLPFPQASQATVRSMILLEKNGRTELYGKTGWTDTAGSNIGWWVGWVKNIDSGAVHVFAFNMEMKTVGEGPRRIELGKVCLRTLGILPED